MLTAIAAVISKFKRNFYIRIPLQKVWEAFSFWQQDFSKSVERSHFSEKSDDLLRKMQEKRDLAPKNSELALKKIELALNL